MRETLREILLTLQLILDTVIAGAADAAEVIALVGGKDRTDLEVYQIGLSRLAIVMMLLPIPILLLGIFGFSMWISVAGLVWAFFTILLSLLAAPIALIIDAIWRRTAVGFGERYVRLTLHVLFAELSFALMLIVVPIDKRPELIPLLLLLALIIFIGTRLFGGASIFNGRAITVVASMIFIAIVISLFLPRTAELARNSAKGIDNGIVTTLTMKPSNAEAGIAASTVPTASQKNLIGTEFVVKANPEGDPGKDTNSPFVSRTGSDYQFVADGPVSVLSKELSGSEKLYPLQKGRFGLKVPAGYPTGNFHFRADRDTTVRVVDVIES